MHLATFYVSDRRPSIKEAEAESNRPYHIPRRKRPYSHVKGKPMNPGWAYIVRLMRAKNWTYMEIINTLKLYGIMVKRDHVRHTCERGKPHSAWKAAPWPDEVLTH